MYLNDYYIYIQSLPYGWSRQHYTKFYIAQQMVSELRFGILIDVYGKYDKHHVWSGEVQW